MSDAIRNFAMNLIAKNPQIANNPQAQELINVIKSGDDAKGQQIAKNICNSYGVTPEQALDRVPGFFGIPFGGNGQK